MVSLTYGHGYCEDCDVAWTDEMASPTLTSTSLTVENNDYFRITGTASAADKYTYFYEHGLSVNTGTYDYFVLRYRTQQTSTGLGAACSIGSGSNYEWLLGDGSDATTPTDAEFNTSWTTVVGDITLDDTVTLIRFFALSDASCSGKWVEYDFLLLAVGAFTFPNTAYGFKFDMPPRKATLQPPGKITDTKQHLGGRSASVRMSCDLDQGDWKRTNDYVDAQVLMDINHNSSDEAFQWYDDGKRRMKVTLEELAVNYIDNGRTTERHLELLLEEYGRGDKSQETVVERFGLDL